MEKEIDQIANQMSPFNCNFLTNIDSEYQDKVVELFYKKLENYSDEYRKLSPVTLNGLDLQRKAVSLENAIRDFGNDKFSPNAGDIYCITLRNRIVNNNLTKEELIKIKQEIFKIESKAGETGFRNLKFMLFSDLLTHMMIIETKNIYPDVLNDMYFNMNIADIEKYYSYFKDKDPDIEKLVYEAVTSLSDLDFLCLYLKNSFRFFPYILKHSEYISDFLLQEVVNNPMCNQRSGVISFNYISADSVTHHKCGRFILEEIHDINSINGDTFIKEAR
jgi:hypothetical protein